MWHVKSEDIKMKSTPSGELFSVLVGRHESTGAAKEQTVAIVDVHQDKKSDPHFHKEREESYYFLSGVGIAKIGDKEVNVKAGDLVFSRPGQLHEFVNIGNTEMKYLVFTSPQWTPEDSHY